MNPLRGPDHVDRFPASVSKRFPNGFEAIKAVSAEIVGTARVAAVLGTGPVRRAGPDFVRASTGQVIGGVAPVGAGARAR